VDSPARPASFVGRGLLGRQAQRAVHHDPFAEGGGHERVAAAQRWKHILLDRTPQGFPEIRFVDKRYAAANHDVIHRLVSKRLGAQIVAGVENHHNFAWKETHLGKEVIVHRKGATPAGKGVLGVIPGSMAAPAFIVRGKGKDESLHSAAHGAGRRMSRNQAREKYNWRAVQKDLEAKGIHVLSAGADEVPGVYKNIEDVMRDQADLVEIVGRFEPRIVKMCDDGSQAED